MSFRLVPKSVTLNDLERRNGPYFALAYFTEFGSFRGLLRKNGLKSSYTFCDGNVAQIIYYLAIYHLWRYIRGGYTERTSALSTVTCAI